MYTCIKNKYIYIYRYAKEQIDAIQLLQHLNYIYTSAKAAVELGDNTLKEANNTYHTLAGFQSQVEKSSQNAALALQTVPGIEQQIQNAERTVDEAENVCTVVYTYLYEIR